MRKHHLRVAIVLFVIAVLCLSRIGHTQNARYHQGPLTITNGAVVQPSLATGNAWASDPTVNAGTFCITGAAVNYYIDGTAPTTANGLPVTAGNCVSIAGFTNLTNLQLIAQTASNATYQAHYFRP